MNKKYGESKERKMKAKEKKRADAFEPIYKKTEKEVSERIKFLKSKIDGFTSQITKADFDDHFKSRITGDKSVRALREYYDELILREEELGLIRNFEYYYQRNKI